MNTQRPLTSEGTVMPQAEQVAKVAGLLRKVNICMLTTQDGSGRLHGRPMAVQQVEFDGDLWFFTARDSSKAQQVRHNPAVNVSFSSIADAVNGGLFVSITGYATLVDDPAKTKELWNDTYKDLVPRRFARSGTGSLENIGRYGGILGRP